MISLYEAIQPSQVVPQANGQVTVTILDPTGIQTTPPGQPPPPPRPAIVGDVYSIQPGGVVQGRQAGSNGPYELAKVVGSAIVWAPQGASGAAYEAPYVSAVPNV